MYDTVSIPREKGSGHLSDGHYVTKWVGASYKVAVAGPYETPDDATDARRMLERGETPCKMLERF